MGSASRRAESTAPPKKVVRAAVREPAARRYWDIVHTPHGAFMAASFAPDAAAASRFQALFLAAETKAAPAACVCRSKPEPSCTCAAPEDLVTPAHEKAMCRLDLQQKKPPADLFYQTGFGWVDGPYVHGPLRGDLVPALLALDQSMLALALRSLLAPDRHTLASRLLAADPVVGARLRRAYKAVDARLAGSPTE